MRASEAIRRAAKMGVGERYRKTGLDQLPKSVRMKVRSRVPNTLRKPLFLYFFDESFDVRGKFLGNFVITLLKSDVEVQVVDIETLSVSLRQMWDGDTESWEKYKSAQVLVIEGITSSNGNKLTSAAVCKVLQPRIANDRPTVLVSSTPPVTFVEEFGDDVEDLLNAFEVWDGCS